MLSPTDLYTAMMARLHADPTAAGSGEGSSTLVERAQRHAEAQATTPRRGRTPLAVRRLRNEVQALDQQLLTRLHQAGFLSHTYLVTLKSVHHATHTLEWPLLKRLPQIQLGVDDQGWTRPLQPTQGPEVDMAHPSWPVVSHWSTLLHEAAHAELSDEPAPLRCTRLPAEVVADLNTYLLGPLAHPNGYFHRMFHEIFADTYGLMLLASVLPHQPEVNQEVHNTLWARSQTRQHDLDHELARRAIVMNLPHLTEWGISRMWDDRDHWWTLTPAERRSQALVYASEGWLAAILPGRPLGQDALDDRLIRYLRQEFLHQGLADHAPHVLTLLREEAARPGSTRQQDWMHHYPDHVAWTAPALRKQGSYEHLPEDQRLGAAGQYLKRAWHQVQSQAQGALAPRADRVVQHILALAPAPEAEAAPTVRRASRGPR